MHRVGRVLAAVLARQPRAGELAEARLRLTLAEILGPELWASCQEVRLRGGTVRVTTHNPALAHQLRLEAEELVRRLNQHSHLARQVRHLEVRVGWQPR